MAGKIIAKIILTTLHQYIQYKKTNRLLVNKPLQKTRAINEAILNIISQVNS